MVNIFMGVLGAVIVFALSANLGLALAGGVISALVCAWIDLDG